MQISYSDTGISKIQISVLELEISLFHNLSLFLSAFKIDICLKYRYLFEIQIPLHVFKNADISIDFLNRDLYFKYRLRHLHFKYRYLH